MSNRNKLRIACVIRASRFNRFDRFVISYFCFITSFSAFASTWIESQNEIHQKNDKELLLLRMHFPFDVFNVFACRRKKT